MPSHLCIGMPSQKIWHVAHHLPNVPRECALKLHYVTQKALKIQNCPFSSNNTVPFFNPERNTAVSNVDLLHATESGWQVHRVRCYRRDYQHIRHDDGEVTTHTRRYGDVLLPSIIIMHSTRLFFVYLIWDVLLN